MPMEAQSSGEFTPEQLDAFRAAIRVWRRTATLKKEPLKIPCPCREATLTVGQREDTFNESSSFDISCPKCGRLVMALDGV
jgi:hypothetical protein